MTTDRSFHGPRALSATLARLTRPLFRRRGLADGAVVTDWPAIVGEVLAAHTVPERLDFPREQRREGTLRLRIDNGALALELQHLEPVLLERINGYFGYRAVARVKLIQGPLPPRRRKTANAPPLPTPEEEQALARQLAAVDDPDLRAALAALGRSVLARNRGRDGGPEEE